MTQTRDGRRKLGLGPGRMRYKLAHTGIQCRIKASHAAGTQCSLSPSEKSNARDNTSRS